MFGRLNNLKSGLLALVGVAAIAVGLSVAAWAILAPIDLPEIPVEAYVSVDNNNGLEFGPLLKKPLQAVLVPKVVEKSPRVAPPRAAPKRVVAKRISLELVATIGDQVAVFKSPQTKSQVTAFVGKSIGTGEIVLVSVSEDHVFVRRPAGNSQRIDLPGTEDE